MTELGVLISEAARTDLLELWVFVAEDSLEAADRLVDDVLAAARRLAEWPEIGRECPDLLPGIRSFPTGNLVIFYRRREDRVEVVRVVHGRRDLDLIF